MREGRCQLHDTMPPTLVRLARRTPSKEDGGTLEKGTDAYPTLVRDDAMTLD
jgi:hypothetical protein